MLWGRLRHVLNHPRVLKHCLLVIPLGLGLWLLHQNLFLGRSTTFSFYPGRLGALIQPADPRSLSGTLRENGKLEWDIASDVTDFVVRPFRSARTIKTQLHLLNTNQPLILFSGVLPSGRDYRTTLVYWKFFNEFTWAHTSNDTVTLWQRPYRTVIKQDSRTRGSVEQIEPVRQYQDYQQFLQDPPDPARIGVYGVDAYSFYHVKDYQPQSDELQLSHSLRGSHSLSVYAENETVRMSFDKLDLNRAAGEDTVLVSVTKGGVTIAQTKVGDDGNTLANSRVGRPQKVTIEAPNSESGVYEVAIITNEDVLIRNLTSPQRKLSFMKRVFLADGPEYTPGTAFQPVKMSTNAMEIQLEAIHSKGLQSVQYGNTHRAIPKIRQPVSLSLPGGPNEIVIERGDLNVTVDSSISLEPFELFTPAKARIFPLVAQPSLEQYDYIVSSYNPASSSSSLITINKKFSGPTLDATDRSTRFRLHTPGLQSGRNQLELKSVRVHLQPFPVNWSRLGLIIRAMLPW